MTIFLSDLLNAFRRKRKAPPSHWRILCLVFDRIDAGYRDCSGKVQRFSFSLPPEGIQKAEWSLSHLPLLARECSCGLVEISYDVRHMSRPLTSLTAMGGPNYWPSPSDVRPELKKYAPSYDSVFVFWPQNDLARGCQVPSGGWGLAIGPGHVPGGATYCSIANAPSYCWEVPRAGEVWLHEWLHGICDFYESKGFPMPLHNADGGGSHGYTQSPVTGWCRYYRDLMTGRVPEDGRMTGITPEAWLSGTIREK
jgi:hypothetical protein